MAGLEYGKKLLSNDAHIIFYQKRQCTHMYKHIHFLPDMAMSQCVGKYTLPIVWEDGLVLFYQKRQVPSHSHVITCTHVQHLPKMVVVVCGKMDLVVFEKYLGTHLTAVSSIGELELPNSSFKSLESTIGRL
jgi:hypothetical protein